MFLDWTVLIKISLAEGIVSVKLLTLALLDRWARKEPVSLEGNFTVKFNCWPSSTYSEDNIWNLSFNSSKTPSLLYSPNPTLKTLFLYALFISVSFPSNNFSDLCIRAIYSHNSSTDSILWVE